MFLLNAIKISSQPLKSVVDALLLTIIVFPMLYLFIFRKMISLINERRKSEEILKASEKRLRSVTESTIDAIISADSDGKIISWNGGAENIFGYKKEEALDKPLTFLMPERYRDAHAMGLDRMSLTGESKVIGKVLELAGQRKDGSEFPLEISLATWEMNGERFFSGIIRDITEKKKTVGDLQLFKDLLNQSSDAIYIIDAETGRILGINEKSCSSTGYSREELLNMPVLDIEAELSDKVSWESHVKLVREGNTTFEGVHKRKDGGTYPVEVNTKLLTLDDKEYLIAVARDVTQRKLMEEELKENVERYNVLFNNAPIAIYVAQDERVKFANPKTAEITGHTHEELLSKPFIGFIHEEDRNMVLERYYQRLRGESPPSTYSFRLVTGKGDIKWVELNVTEFSWEGRPAVLCHLSDITERKYLEEEIIEMATTDSLTGVNNRRNFFEKASDEFVRSRRYESPLSVIMIDIDHFKSINDSFGHHVGDQVLKAMAQSSVLNLRETDIIGRIGGEEFAAILVKTDAQTALEVAERLRRKISELSVSTEGDSVRFTVSIGLTSKKHDDTLEDVVNRADKALYMAKEKGRNCVVQI